MTALDGLLKEGLSCHRAGDLVAAEREKRLSTIDADSEAIEARVRAEEEAEAKAQQQAAPQDGTSPPPP